MFVCCRLVMMIYNYVLFLLDKYLWILFKNKLLVSMYTKNSHLLLPLQGRGLIQVTRASLHTKLQLLIIKLPCISRHGTPPSPLKKINLCSLLITMLLHKYLAKRHLIQASPPPRTRVLLSICYFINNAVC